MPITFITAMYVIFWLNNSIVIGFFIKFLPIHVEICFPAHDKELLLKNKFSHKYFKISHKSTQLISLVFFIENLKLHGS